MRRFIRGRRERLAGALLSGLSAGALVCADEPFELPVDAVQRELSPGQSHGYRVVLTRGQYLQVSVSQPVADLVIRVSGPEGQELAEVDTHQREPERVRLVAESGGAYRLEVKAREATRARYEIVRESLRAVEPEDAKRIAAETLAGEAKRLRFQGSQAGRRRAIELLGQALAVWRDLADAPYVARTLNDLGVMRAQLGDVQDGLKALEESLALRRSMGDRAGEATALHNLGSAYRILGDSEKALGHLNQALQLRRLVEDRWGEEKTLHNIGGVYEDIGDPAKALANYEQALVILRELGADLSGLALTLDELGSLALEVGDRSKALGYFGEALDASRNAGDPHAEALSLHRIGSAYASAGETAKALAHYESALTLRREMGNWLGELESLYRIARLFFDQGDLLQARVRVEQGLGIVEGVRGKVASQGLRAAYMASHQPYYDLAVEVLMALHRRSPRQGYDALALAMSERGRARSLLETLAEARGNIRAGVDSALLDREKELREKISAKEWQIRRLLGEKADARKLESEQELATLLGDYERLQGEIREKSPRYAELTEPRPLGLAEIRERVLDDESLLLEYDLGEERSHLWAVTRESLKSYQLPPRKDVEALARRVHELLVASRERGKRAAWQGPARELSRMVLGPVASDLSGKRLLVVADGALQYVPFAALPRPSGGGLVPLVAGHEVLSLPSASVMAVLRRELAGRPSAGRTVAVLADPVLRPDDPRVRLHPMQGSAGPVPSAKASDVERSASETGATGLPRLPFTRREARAIASLAPRGGALVALDFEANRETVTRPELAQYRVVHFATHGLLNSQHPELSGIVLSLVDEQGKARDGFLRLHDLYNMRLGADVVVLSACQTALGKDVKGEGLVSLTRGFMYAGAPRVVASLWNVRDDATSELMKRFYTRMLKGGRTPAAALRAAQISMWREPRFQAPYYWAAFVLQGEWKAAAP